MDLNLLLHEIAEHSTLLWLFGFFIGMVLFILRPGSKAIHDDAAQVPLRERETLACPNACPGCTCAAMPDFLGDVK
jgi:cytochrome c oxidase cbb3-type subunit 4